MVWAKWSKHDNSILTTWNVGTFHQIYLYSSIQHFAKDSESSPATSKLMERRKQVSLRPSHSWPFSNINDTQEDSLAKAKCPFTTLLFHIICYCFIPLNWTRLSPVKSIFEFMMYFIIVCSVPYQANDSVNPTRINKWW